MSMDHIYCRKCGYDLRASNQLCTECGGAFDRSNPRTFARRPPRNALCRWFRRTLVFALGAMFLLCAVAAWLYFGWRGDQAVIAKMGTSPQVVADSEPLGGPLLKKELGPFGFVLDRCDKITFNCDGSSVDDAAIGRLKELPHLRDLTVFEGNNISDRGFASIGDLGFLQQLDLWDPAITDQKLGFFKDLHELYFLSLTNSQVTGSGLCQLTGLHKLQTLALDHSPITDAAAANIEQFHSLEYLFLDDTLITDTALARIKNMHTLKLLSLNNTRITDAGLAEIKNLPLTDLRIDGTRITKAGLENLKEMRTLKHLDCRCADLYDDRNELQRMVLPGVEVCGP